MIGSYLDDLLLLIFVISESLLSLIERLSGPFNVEMTIDPLSIKISDAIMNFQEAGFQVSYNFHVFIYLYFSIYIYSSLSFSLSHSLSLSLSFSYYLSLSLSLPPYPKHTL